eukprot:6579017-Karenia_brevis.AAC.1
MPLALGAGCTFSGIADDASGHQTTRAAAGLVLFVEEGEVVLTISEGDNLKGSTVVEVGGVRHCIITLKVDSVREWQNGDPALPATGPRTLLALKDHFLREQTASVASRASAEEGVAKMIEELVKTGASMKRDMESQKLQNREMRSQLEMQSKLVEKLISGKSSKVKADFPRITSLLTEWEKSTGEKASSSEDEEADEEESEEDFDWLKETKKR